MVQIGAGYLHDMKELVNDEEFSDVTFIVENRPVHALRAILAKRCEHFSAMFRSGMRESEAGVEIPIPNLSYPVFLLIMEYLCEFCFRRWDCITEKEVIADLTLLTCMSFVDTDAVKIEVEHAVELYIAADLYQLSTLREMCCVVVKRNISADNAAYMLQVRCAGAGPSWLDPSQTEVSRALFQFPISGKANLHYSILSLPPLAERPRELLPEHEGHRHGLHSGPLRHSLEERGYQGDQPRTAAGDTFSPAIR